MKIRTLIDTGPLVALLTRDDQHHAWAVDAFKQASAEGIATCEAVVSEASFLLSRWPEAVDHIFRRLSDATLRLLPMDAESSAVHALMKKYRNVPASYADACLIRLSELHGTAMVMTTDTDFRVYRRNGRQAIPRIAPF